MKKNLLVKRLMQMREIIMTTNSQIPFVLSVLALAVGCGGGNNKMVPVSGIVTLDGQVLQKARIVFDRPDLGPNENTGFQGTTDEQGHYVLKALGKDLSGIPPGEYRVSLTTAFLEPPYLEHTPLSKERVPQQYRDGSLHFLVEANGTGEANFDLKSP